MLLSLPRAVLLRTGIRHVEGLLQPICNTGLFPTAIQLLQSVRQRFCQLGVAAMKVVVEGEAGDRFREDVKMVPALVLQGGDALNA